MSRDLGPFHPARMAGKHLKASSAFENEDGVNRDPCGSDAPAGKSEGQETPDWTTEWGDRTMPIGG